MLPHEKAELLAAVNQHREAHDKPKLTAAGAQEWLDCLRDLPLGDCLRALLQHSKTSTWTAKPSNVHRLVTGRDEGGVIAKERHCAGAGCGDVVVIERDGKWYCSGHYDSTFQTTTPAPLPFRWQDLMGAYRALELFSEARARRAFGDKLVDYVIQNHEQVDAMMPPRGPQRVKLPQGLAA